MKCILNYCGGSISLHCNFWHVIFDAWTRDIGCVARELDIELVTSKITGLMSPFAYCIGGVFADFGKENICFLHVFGPYGAPEWTRKLKSFEWLDCTNNKVLNVAIAQTIKF